MGHYKTEISEPEFFHELYDDYRDRATTKGATSVFLATWPGLPLIFSDASNPGLMIFTGACLIGAYISDKACRNDMDKAREALQDSRMADPSKTRLVDRYYSLS